VWTAWSRPARPGQIGTDVIWVARILVCGPRSACLSGQWVHPVGEEGLHKDNGG
jgi:hypothetical protein